MNQSQHHKASLPGQVSNLPVNETVFSIVHHSKNQTKEDEELIAVTEDQDSLGDYEIRGNYEPPKPPLEKQGLEQLLTPWGIGALFILLFANMLLSWSQWSTQKPLANVIRESHLPSPKITPSKPVHQTPENSSPSLTIDRLSVVSVPATSAAPTPNFSIKTPAPPTVVPKSSTTLTNALLPPSLQPQLIQTYSPPVAQSPSVSQPLAAMPVSQPQPVPPAIKPSPVSSPPVTPTLEQKAILEQQRILEQMRIREQTPEPLGFNHQTRAKLRSAENQQAPSELVEQLQQLQQPKLNESNTNNGIPTSTPAQ